MLSNRSLSPQSRPLGEGTSAEVWLLHLDSREKKKKISFTHLRSHSEYIYRYCLATKDNEITVQLPSQVKME